MYIIQYKNNIGLWKDYKKYGYQHEEKDIKKDFEPYKDRLNYRLVKVIKN